MISYRLALFIFVLSITFTACGQKKMKEIELTNATIKIDSCGIYYQGKRLELGQTIKEWEEVLGKPSRSTSLGEVWDNIGIAVDDWQNRDGQVARVYIFFLNLDSPEGKAGNLTMARDFESVEHVVERNMENGVSLIIEEVKQRIEERNNEKLRTYIYPYTTYQGCVDLHGGPVGAGMKVEEINAYRKKLDLSFTGLFRYLDQDVDGIDHTGVTEKTFGGEYSTYGTACKDARIMAYSLVYNYDETLEYLLLRRESIESYQDRIEREEENKE